MRRLLFSLSLLFAAGLLFSCTEDIGKDCGCVTPPELCRFVVTAEQTDCSGYGAYGSIYFRQEHDDRLIQAFALAQKFETEIEVGQKYYIGYQEIADDGRYKDRNICELYNKEVREALRAEITCLSPAPCGNTVGTVRDMTGLDGCGKMIETEAGQFLNPVNGLFSDLPAGTKIRFAYSDADVASVCMKGRNIRLECSEIISVPCETLVTVKDFGCTLNGAYGGLVLLTDEGKYLLPWKNAPGFTAPKLENGMRIKIAAVPTLADARFAHLQVCPTFAPLPETEPVTVYCIEIQN